LEPSVDGDYLACLNQTISVIPLPKKVEAPVEEDPKKKKKQLLKPSGLMAFVKEGASSMGGLAAKILHVGEKKAAEAAEAAAAEVLGEKK
jgi:hypothetical protein